jgi:hypothetical protein
MIPLKSGGFTRNLGFGFQGFGFQGFGFQGFVRHCFTIAYERPIPDT